MLILRLAWLNLWDKHMTTGRINQVSIVSSRHKWHAARPHDTHTLGYKASCTSYALHLVLQLRHRQIPIDCSRAMKYLAFTPCVQSQFWNKLSWGAYPCFAVSNNDWVSTLAFWQATDWFPPSLLDRKPEINRAAQYAYRYSAQHRVPFPLPLRCFHKRLHLWTWVLDGNEGTVRPFLQITDLCLSSIHGSTHPQHWESQPIALWLSFNLQIAKLWGINRLSFSLKAYSS